MEKCSRCSKTSEEVRLFDGFEGMLSVKICERCSLIANIPVIRRPDMGQLRNSERNDSVRNRLMRLAGIKTPEKKDPTIYESIKKLDEKPELEKPDSLQFKLVDNFHWKIFTERRRKGLTLKQLADRINDSESAIKMLEKGNFPSGSLDLVKKIEVYFKIQLVKNDMPKNQTIGKFNAHRLPPPFEPENINLGEKSFEKIMSEKEGEEMVQIAIKDEKSSPALKKESVQGTPLKLVDFRRHEKDEISIADLKRMNERVEKDFTKKTVLELGPEQTAGMENISTDYLRKTVYRTNTDKKNPEKTPTIYDLMKKKEERDKEITGRDIDLAKEEKDKTIVL